MHVLMVVQGTEKVSFFHVCISETPLSYYMIQPLESNIVYNSGICFTGKYKKNRSNI